MKKSITTTLIFLSTLFNVKAFAYPSTLHYSVATGKEPLALDSIDLWDSEASSDFVTYQLPLEWEGQWWRANQSFDLSVGSISSKHFLSYKRIKVRKFLTEKLELNLQYLEARDFEQDRSSLPLELIYWFKPKWGLSAFGTPSLYKSEDDIGLALHFRPTKDFTIRFSNLWGDFQLNERNIQPDRWTMPAYSQTLSATYLPEDSQKFLNAELHYEPQSTRVNTAAGTRTDLSYRALLLTANWGRLLYDEADQSLNGEVSKRQRFLNQFEKSFWLGAHRVRPGLNIFYRQTRRGLQQTIDREVLPTVWVDGPQRPMAWGVRTVSAGLDSTIFSREVDGGISDSWQNRLNIKLDMRFIKSGQLALLFTADLDQLGSGESWEGGAGQFRIDF